MGTPSSGSKAEIFLQHTEHAHLALLAHRHRIINYLPYADDILLIFYSTHKNVHAILNDFNAIHPKVQFTAEIERNNTLNYLDISIHGTPTSLKTSIYRKPTFTDTIIPYTSNHPTQHKYAAVKFLFNRLNSYDLQTEEYQHELNIIQNILYNSSFPIRPHTPTIHTPAQQQVPKTPRHRWATFTYVGKETSYITNVFRRTDLRIAYRTNNNKEFSYAKKPGRR
jgi:hypothetical protein